MFSDLKMLGSLAYLKASSGFLPWIITLLSGTDYYVLPEREVGVTLGKMISLGTTMKDALAYVRGDAELVPEKLKRILM